MIRDMSKKYVVYTALFGSYDNLPDVSACTSPEVDFICFTDSDFESDKGWEVVKVDNQNLTSAMRNRYYKLNPHAVFSDYTYSLYIDSNIKLSGDPKDIFEKYMNEYTFVMPKHADRVCIFKEAKECIIQKKGNKLAITKQMQKYKNEGMPEGYGLGENNILLRRHNDAHIIKIMNDWWNELQTQSQRDQLSLAYVLWRNNTTFSFMEETCRNNNLFFKYQPHKNYQSRNLFNKLKDRISLLIRRTIYFRWCP
jgi:hypothetical protein